MWQNYLFLPLVSLILTLQSLFSKLYSNKYTGEVSFSSPVYSVLYGFSVALITLAVSGFSYQPSLLTLVLGTVNGFAMFVYNYSLIEGGRRGPFSFVMICNLFGGVLIPLFVMMLMPRAVELFAGKSSSLWFSPQDLTLLQYCAMLVALVAFVFLNKGNDASQKPGKGYYFWSILLGLANGLYCVVLALQAALRPDDRSEILVTTFFVGGLVSLVYLLGISRKRFFSAFRMPPLAWVFALCACLIATLASNLLTYVLSLFDNSAVVNATNNGLILIFTAISSVLLFREKMGRMKILGAVLCVISIILLNL